MSEKRIKLNKILDLDKLNQLFYQFYVVSGLDVALYDEEGNEELHCGKIAVCERSLAKKACREAIKYGGEKACELNAPYIFETPCGLVKCSVPVVMEKNLIGSIVCGPVILWDADDFAKEEFGERLVALGLDADKATLDEIPHKECDYMTGAATMLKVLVDYICFEESLSFSQKLEIARLNDERNAVMEHMQIAREKSEYHLYPAQLEKELINYVRMGDKSKAKAIINSFLNEIFFFADGDLDTIKAKLYELMAYLSRTAVEAGAGTADIKNIVKKSARLLLENIEFQDICLITVELLDSFIDVVYRLKPQKTRGGHLRKAMDFINGHYGEELNLDTVAKEVYLSSFYLSHLFREGLNMTFSEYLTKVRIEHAMEFLSETGATVEDVAERTGFKDGNYFSKIFKKIVGTTPAKYKKR